MTIEQLLKISSPLPPDQKAVIQLIYNGDKLHSAINTVLKPHGLTNQQFNVLRILRGQKGSAVSMTEIQQRMISKNSNVTRLIDKLHMKKLVSRKTDQSNRRKLKISISQQGLNLLDTVDPLVTEIDKKMSSRLNAEELENLNALLEKMRC